MPWTASIVGLTVIAVLNLVLLLAIVRRVNSLAEQGSRSAKPAVAKKYPLPVPGAQVGAFAARTTEGERIGTADLVGPTLVGFFTVGCPPCEAFRPDFERYAEEFPGGRQRVLALIAGGRGDPTELANRLGRLATVIIEPPRGPVATAFGVDAFPAACVLTDDRVAAAGFDLRDIDQGEFSTP